MTMIGRRLPAPTSLALSLLLFSLVATGNSSGAILTRDNLIHTRNATHARIEIRLDDAIDIRVVDQTQAKERSYFFIDLYKTKAAFNDTTLAYSDGVLEQVQIRSYPDLNVLRIVFYPKNRTIFRVADAATGFEYPKTLISATKLAAQRTKTRRIIIDTPKTRDIPLPTLQPDRIIKHRQTGPKGNVKRLVVIDPGHGGGDPGAVSRQKIGGQTLQEKKLALAVSRELCRLLNKTPNISAVLTRNTDKPISLEKRVDFSEKLNADLFVSIHLNSTGYAKNRTARGPEFYYFSTESKNENRALVQAENTAGSSVKDPQGKEAWKKILSNLVKDILAKHRGESNQLADHISTTFDKDPHFRKYNRGVKSAPFRVLMNMVSPAVLLEIGFIDNADEATQLANSDYQNRIAKLISNGILRHFAQLDSQFVYYQF